MTARRRNKMRASLFMGLSLVNARPKKLGVAPRQESNSQARHLGGREKA
jgi:hypothetical protein